MKVHSIFGAISNLKYGRTATCVSHVLAQGQDITFNDLGDVVWVDTGECLSMTKEVLESQWQINYERVNMKEALEAHKQGRNVYSIKNNKHHQMPKTATPEEIDDLMGREWVVTD